MRGRTPLHEQKINFPKRDPASYILRVSFYAKIWLLHAKIINTQNSLVVDAGSFIDRSEIQTEGHKFAVSQLDWEQKDTNERTCSHIISLPDMSG